MPKEAKRKQVKPRARSPNAGEEKTKEELSRRAFLRKSAEIAAIALFGTLTLDEITDKVLERLASWSSATRIGKRAAARLRESLGGGKAYAHTCTGFDDYCQGGGDYPHSCTGGAGNPYKCEPKFWCDPKDHSFACHGDGNGTTWFGCGVYPNPGGYFQCKPSAGQGATFGCGRQGHDDSDFHCSEKVHCEFREPGGPGGFECSPTVGDQVFFDCTTYPHEHHFKCPGDDDTDPFYCPADNGTVKFSCTVGYKGPIEHPPEEEEPAP